MSEDGQTPAKMRKILHVDMDAFFASVEQRDRPELRGRALAVGGTGGRGVVAAASYEARTFGVRSAMPVREALRRCPQLVVVRPDISRYRSVSAEVFGIFREATPLVEALSLDEAFLDVTENLWNEPSATLAAIRIKERIRTKLELTASAGVSTTKSVAKIASGYKKPDGLTVVPPGRIRSFLAPLGIEKLWGVGPVTAGKLHSLGLKRIGELAALPLGHVRELLGSQGERLWELANGIDPRRVVTARKRKSQSAEQTFSEDVTELEALESVLVEQAARVCGQLTKAGRKGRTVTLKVRYGDFTTLTRSQTLPEGTSDPSIVAAIASALLRKTEAGARPVRLLGVGLSGFGALGEAVQLRIPFPNAR